MPEPPERHEMPVIPGFVETATLVQPRPEESGKDRTMVLNMGPQHPSTHGVLRLVLEIDGETVVSWYRTSGTCTRGSRRPARRSFTSRWFR